MLQYNEIFQANANIPEEWFEAIRKEVIGLVDLRLTGRELFDVLRIPADMEQFSYDRLADVSAAALTAKGGAIPRDVVSLSRATFDVPQVSKGYFIHRIDAMKRQFVNLSLRRAARAVAEGIDELLYLGTVDGVAAPSVVGIDGASTAAASALDNGVWDGATKTADEIYNDVNNLLKELELTGTAGTSPTLVVNSAQFGEARLLNVNTDTNAMKLVTEGLGVSWIRAYTPAVPDGTAYIIGDKGSDIMQVVVAEDVNTERAVYDLERQSFLSNIFARLLPVIYQYGTVANQSQYIIKQTGL